ncbi:hypothetical protein BH10BAC1_BH10BAC1_06250 [soil metagenome]
MRVLIVCFFIGFNSFLFGQNEFNYYFNQGQEKYANGNYNGAASDFSTALKNRQSAKNDYSIANAYRARAFCKMELKNYSSAIADISDAIKLKPEYSDLYMARSIIHMNAKQFNEAIKWANVGLALKPEYENLILIKGKAKYAQKNYKEAIADFDTILRINPKNVNALNLKGSVLSHTKDFNAAIAAFTKTIEIDAQNFAAFYDRGICWAHLKKFDEALADINRGMEIDSTEKWIGYNNIAFFIKFEEKDYEGAIVLFDKAIKLNPEFAYAYSNRGYAKMKLNDLKGARKDILKSLEISPENSYAYKTYAQLLFAEKKDKEACEKLKKANQLGYSEEYDEDVNVLIKESCK